MNPRSPVRLMILSALILGTRIAYGQPEAGLTRKLDSSNAVERRTAMKELAIKNPEDGGNAILPYLRKGLGDADPEVRSHSAAALYRIATMIYFASKSKDGKAYGKKISTDLALEPGLREALLRAADDSSNEVREYAASTLSMGYPKAPDIEDRLARQLKKEKSSRVRGAIVKGLVEREYSSKETTSALVAALDDANGEVRGVAAKGIAKIRPPEALPKLAKGLETKDPFAQKQYVEALRSYGNAAKPYLPTLEKVMSKTTDKQMKGVFQNAVNEIKSGKER